jgi:hypothetical protein
MILEHLVRGLRQIRLEPADGRVAILEIARGRPLAAVQIERTDAVTRGGERDRRVHGRRRLAGAALFVGEDDEMRLSHA